MSMNPDTMAFIKGDNSPTIADSAGGRRRAKGKTIDVELTDKAGVMSEEEAPRITRGRRPRQRSEGTQPSDRDILGEVLVPLTTRLPHRLVQSLRRICLEQQLRHAKPDSIQEIVEASLEAWLVKQQ